MFIYIFRSSKLQFLHLNDTIKKQNPRLKRIVPMIVNPCTEFTKDCDGLHAEIFEFIFFDMYIKYNPKHKFRNNKVLFNILLMEIQI
jgi:hypothetical protein